MLTEKQIKNLFETHSDGFVIRPRGPVPAITKDKFIDAAVSHA